MIQKRTDTIVTNLKKFFKTAGFTKAVVGLSGGVDSALVAKLGVMVLGKENVTAILMPYTGLSDERHVEDARTWAEELAIKHVAIPINRMADAFKKLPWEASPLASMNIKARVRANILYHFANTHDAIVLGTGNKTEETLGYFTKYGDGAVDVLPIGSLYKTEVWDAAKALGLPRAIIDKTPTAELAHGQTDEKEIGASYADIDAALQHLESGEAPRTALEKDLQKRIRANHHKSVMPPVIASS